MSDSNEHWIPVTTSPGGFSSEKAVLLQLANGEMVSFFADENLLTQKGQNTFLRVTLVSSGQGKEVVLLPSETFETASPWAEITAA